MQQQQPPQQQQQAKQPQQTPPQPHSHQVTAAASYQQIPQFTPAPYYQTRGYGPNHYTYSPYPFTHHYPAPHPQWPHQATNFSPTPPQPQLANMVTSQPPSNVPQQHNKTASQMINPVDSADPAQVLTQRQGVTMPKQATPVWKPRERKPASLKDPNTNQEVPLPNTTTSPVAKTSSVAATKPSSSAQTLLQKVSEATTSSSTAATATTTTTTNDAVPAKNELQDQEQSHAEGETTTNNGRQMDTLTNGAGSSESKREQPLAKIETTTSNPKTTTAVTTTAVAPAESASAAPTVQKAPIVSKTITTAAVSRETATAATITLATPISATAPTTTTTTTTTRAETTTKTPPTITTPNITPILKVESISSSNKDSSDSNTINGEEKNDSEINELESQVDSQAEEETTSGKDDSEGLKNDVKPDDSENKEEQNSEKALVYETWQYNPLANKSGKKIYSKQFLIDVCEKICKTDCSRIYSDDKNGSDQLPNAFSEKIDMFAPAYSSINQRFATTNRQNDSSRRQSQHNYAGRSSAGQERQRKVITSVSLTQEVELKTTSNPWRPTKDIKEDVPTDVVETESLKKKFRSILNKLTPNNFESLAQAVTGLTIDNEAKLGEVIDIVFAKALAEPGYCVLYGQMCSHLKKITAGTANFGNTLLRRCQHQFQSDIYSGLNLKERRDKIDDEQDPEIKKQLNEELYEDMYRCRMRGLGLIKFIGELYKIEMLNDKIMFDCVIRLLSDTSEESLECLCDLLATIGEKLDRSSQENAEKEKAKKAPKSASKANAYQAGQKSIAAVVATGSTQQQKAAAAAAAAEQQPTCITTLDQVFDQLHKIRRNKDLPLSVRIRFKLLDTCELREKDNWHSKKSKDNNPKKIEEIREAHKEKLEQERRQQNAMGPRRSQEGRRGLGHSSGSSNQISSLANESSGNRGISTMHTSSSSHLLRDHSVSDNMKSNHNDIESQKEHQKKIESFKGIQNNLFHRTSEPMEQGSQMTLRPMNAGSGLRPFSSLNKKKE